MTLLNSIIGIDTGGTFTDAVIIDADLKAVLATAKSLTTKGDLSIGVINAMRAAIANVPGFDAKTVNLVSVSTTLATNAVVEGHGNAVGLILAGFDQAMFERSGLGKAFPTMPVLRIAGGHDHNGAENAKLDFEQVKAWLNGAGQDVSAYAVAATFAVRNNNHEITLGTYIRENTAKPVTMSHDLASALDAPRRAQTAVLNARLVSRIADLTFAVEKAMAEQNITCPLMLVKGDGSLGRADAVKARPIETVLSGPAASLIGAQWLSGLDTFLMSDMGGTTTDVGLLLDGRPEVAEQGAEVGGWRTMVKAIDVKTIGLGGDSEVHIAEGSKLELGPQRAVPISLLASRFADLPKLLEADLSETAGGSLLGKFLVLPFGAETGRQVAGLNEREAEVFAAVSHVPLALRYAATSSSGQRAVASLRKRGLIQFCSFTPSDAAHVLGLQDNWPGPSALLAARLFARARIMKQDEQSAKDLALEVWNKAVEKSARVVLDHAFGQALTGPLVDAIVAGRTSHGRVNVSLAPQMPIVAVGGPVKIYYPELGKRLACEVVFAPHCDVANAIGAAAGMVSCISTVQVEGDGSGVFRLTGEGAVAQFTSGADALKAGVARAEAAALLKAQAQGCATPEVKTSIEKHFMPQAKDDEGILTAKISAEARGLPSK